MTSIYKRTLILGKGMNDIGALKGSTLSPDSDCNSNHHGSTSYLSASSQDIDFIQDNSDYQWFLDYGYRDGGTNHHTSILSLPETFETGDLNYYDAMAKNMDANLAEADMESFRTEDIHALLTNLPPMCSNHLSQENNRQGESYASVSGSMMGKFDFDSSLSPHSSSQGEESASMSICKSELLFSPVKEIPMPGANFSVDSLDCDLHDMMLTCQANKDNYTIAFEGSMTLYSEDSDFQVTDKSNNSRTGSADWIGDLKNRQIHNMKKWSNATMAQSDSGSFTTWSKLKTCTGDSRIRRHPSGNNNNSGDENTHLDLQNDNALKSQSMPNLHKRRLKATIPNNLTQHQNDTSVTSAVKRKPVKVFNIQHHQTQSYSASLGTGSVSDMATSVDASSSENLTNSKQPNFSLVKLFMKQKSMSTEGMSTTMDQLSSTENWPESGASNSAESRTSGEENKISDISEEGESNENGLKTVMTNKTDELSCKTSSFTNETGNSVNEHCLYNINNKLKISSPKKHLKIKNILVNQSIQTSHFSEMANLKNAHKTSYSNIPNSYKVIEPSFLNKLKTEGEVQKPVYVLYPNYVLPNLDFLNEKQEDLAKILLLPQRAPTVFVPNKRRPLSCNDLELLKKKGFSHIADWDSLNFLLPTEYKHILADVPEISDHIKQNSHDRPTFMSHVKRRARPMSSDYSGVNNTNVSSSSSTATQPSSGYRGSSTMLDSQNCPSSANNLNPLFVYRYDSVTSSESSLVSDKQRSITTMAPQLPRRGQHCTTVTDCAPPRPPLPKGILYKADASKRYSMHEPSDHEVYNDNNKYKRISLTDPYYFPRNKRVSETEDEGVDAGTSSSSLEEHLFKKCRRKSENIFSQISEDELVQFEEFLKVSGISSSDAEDFNEESLTHLRSYVSKFLSLKMNQDEGEYFGGKKSVSFAEKVNILPKHLAPNNSPNVSAFAHKNYQNTTPKGNYENHDITQINKDGHCLVQKWGLVNAVTRAVEEIVHHFSSASSHSELIAIGDSNLNPTCAKIALTSLCPALYAVLSDGLKANIETSFGAINNSVWQVVEASAKQGPLTKALNELVMRINSEDALTEGLVKFNTFVFGLLNVRSLDAWASYLRTRESVLQKHYSNNSMMVLSHTGSPEVRTLLDKLVSSLQPLALLPFQLDLFYEYRQLHMSLKRMDNYQQALLSPTHKYSPKQWLSGHSNRSNSDSEETSQATAIHHRFHQNEEGNLPDLLNSSSNSKVKSRSDKERPRSCCEPGILSKPNFKLGEDVASIAKKRWSGIALNSKLYQVYDRLAREEDEDYTDSLENANDRTEDDNVGEISMENRPPESLDSNLSDDKPLNGRKFKKLQERWEKLSGKESSEESPPPSPTQTPNKSRIPRLITSPIKPSGIPVPVSPTSKNCSKLPGSVKYAGKVNAVKSLPCPRPTSRTSRVDKNEIDTPKHPPRPSSLPYKAASYNSKTSKITPPRRAVSNSVNRRPLTANSKIPKVVKTLSHRLHSESGHLSYNEGENLKVILKVDDKWLLCCRGTQKGLVPISSVISADLGRF